MFKKPFSIATQSKVKGSDARKLRSNVAKNFTVTDDELETILPTKDLLAHKLDNKCVVYVHEGQPIFIDVAGRGDLVPTVYTLWCAAAAAQRGRCGHLIPSGTRLCRHVTLHAERGRLTWALRTTQETPEHVPHDRDTCSCQPVRQQPGNPCARVFSRVPVAPVARCLCRWHAAGIWFTGQPN